MDATTVAWWALPGAQYCWGTCPVSLFFTLILIVDDDPPVRRILERVLRGKCERVIAEVESAAREGRIKTTPARYAEQIWKEFAP